MSSTGYVNVFFKIAWDFGLLKEDLVKIAETQFSIPKSPKITNELEVKPTTLYLMQYMHDGCQANCAFCVQSLNSMRERKSSYLVENQLIRFPLNTVIQFIKQRELPFKRICIQTVLHNDSFSDLINLIKELKKASDLPISANCTPLNKEQIAKLHSIGLDRIIINYELVTPELFEKIRGRDRNSPYSWELTGQSLDYALEIFGAPRVLSHLLIGIGETDREVIQHICMLYEKKIIPSLFAFRPLRGTDLEKYPRISHARFHSIQIAYYLIRNNYTDIKNMTFDPEGNLTNPGVGRDEIKKIIYEGKCFLTSGCPGCNRPNYTVDLGERHYTYPRIPSRDELRVIEKEIFSGWNLS